MIGNIYIYCFLIVILLMEEILHQCTSWYAVYPTIYKVLYIPGGCLGFLPSTVVAIFS